MAVIQREEWDGQALSTMKETKHNTIAIGKSNKRDQRWNWEVFGEAGLKVLQSNMCLTGSSTFQQNDSLIKKV